MHHRFTRGLIVSLICGLVAGASEAGAMRIVGSSIVSPPVAEAIRVLKKQQDVEIEVSSMGGAAAGIASLGAGTAGVAMLARHVQPEDRVALPEVKLTEIEVGRQVASLCVSADVWKSGIHALGAEQIRGIYEGRIKNWKEVGGGDLAISFFNWEESYGMWELLAEWLYGSASKAPKGKYTSIASNEEARNAIEFTKGAIALMSPKLAADDRVCLIALTKDKEALLPSVENVAANRYPLTRPLVLVIDDKPTGPVKVAIDFLLSPEGQRCFEKAGFFTATELRAHTPPSSSNLDDGN